MAKKRFERNYRDTVPLKHGAYRDTGNLTPLYRSSGKLFFTCPICFLGFEKYACWAKRTANHYCSRACSNEAKKITVVMPCVVCGTAMQLNPTLSKRKFTCSHRCLRLKRLRRTKDLRYTIDYLKSLRLLKERGRCELCGVEHGPWVAVGIKTTREEGELPVVDDSSAKLVCKSCYGSKISANRIYGWLNKTYGCKLPLLSVSQENIHG